MRAAIYARVSTTGHGQDPQVQTREIREYCERRGWQIAGEYIDAGVSGAKDSRPELNRLAGRCPPSQVRCRCGLEVRPIRPLGVTPAACSRNVQCPRHRVRESERADRHKYAHREISVHGPGCRCRTRAQLDCRARASRTAKRTGEREAAWASTFGCGHSQNRHTAEQRRVLGNDLPRDRGE